MKPRRILIVCVMQGLHLSCVAVELFPETINETLHFSSDHSMCTMDRVINFLLNLAMDEGSAWVVREKAVLTGLRLLTSCVSCLHSSVQVCVMHYCFITYSNTPTRIKLRGYSPASEHFCRSTLRRAPNMRCCVSSTGSWRLIRFNGILYTFNISKVLLLVLILMCLFSCFEDLVTCAMAIEVCRVNMEEVMMYCRYFLPPYLQSVYIGRASKCRYFISVHL